MTHCMPHDQAMTKTINDAVVARCLTNVRNGLTHILQRQGTNWSEMVESAVMLQHRGLGIRGFRGEQVIQDCWRLLGEACPAHGVDVLSWLEHPSVTLDDVLALCDRAIAEVEQ